MIDKRVGKRIKAFRSKKKLTQEQLAELLDISTNHLSSIERGVYSVRVELLVRIANCLDCTTNDLLKDVMINGYQVHSSRLYHAIKDLYPEKRDLVLQVVEAMVNHTP